MTTTISQVAGDYAIQFGSIGHVGAIYILNHDSAVGNKVTLASPENQHLRQPRRLPVSFRPRSFPLLLGRREEVIVAVNTLPYDQPMEFYGSAGIGKTALLRYLAHHPSIAPAFSDGIVYHHLVRYQSVSDLLQVLFDAFYESQTLFKASDMQIRDALKNKKALILLDAATLTREEVDGLLNNLPSCTFLFASLERQLWGEGRAVELGGLPLNEAVALVAQELGHPFSPEERSDAEKLCIALEGHPLRILQAVAIAREEKLSLAAIVQRVQGAAAKGAWTREILLSLTQPQRVILALFTALGANVALKAEHIANITELPEVKPALEVLLRRNLIQVDDGRYNLTSNLIKELQQEKWNLTPWMERTTSFFTDWVQHWGTPEQLLPESDTILRILEWAVGANRWSDVLCLGRAVQGILALSGQWGAWDLVLKWMLEAARAIRDRAAEAFVLHQLGTRSLCLSEIADAQSYLTEALEIRKSLNDRTGIEVTHHNLNFLVEPAPPSDPPFDPAPDPLPNPRPNPLNRKKWLFALGGGVGVLLFALLLLFLILSNKRLLSSGGNIPVSPEESEFPTPSPSGKHSPSSGGRIPSSPRETTSPFTSPITPQQTFPKLTLNLSRTTTNWGDTVEGTVSLDKPAPEEGIEVTLSSRNPSLAEPEVDKVKVKAGEKTAPVSIQIAQYENVANKYPSGGSVEITASYNGVSTKAVTLTVGLKKEIANPLEIESLTLNPKRVQLGTRVDGVLKLKSPAPDSGVTIALETNHPLIQELPPSVPFQAGEQEKPFSFLISQDGANSQIAAAVPNNQTVTVTAVYGRSTQQDSVTVIPAPAPVLQSLELSQYRIDTCNFPEQGQVSLSTPATQNVVFTLSSTTTLVQVPQTRTIRGWVSLSTLAPQDVKIILSSTEKFVQVQPSVTIPAGKTTESFPVTVEDTIGSATIQASLDGGKPLEKSLMLYCGNGESSVNSGMSGKN